MTACPACGGKLRGDEFECYVCDRCGAEWDGEKLDDEQEEAMTNEPMWIPATRERAGYLEGQELNPATAVMELAEARRERIRHLARIVELEAANAQLAGRASGKACSVCWTVSWEPVLQEDPGAIPDGHGGSGFMRCGYCFQHEQVLALSRELVNCRELLEYEMDSNRAATHAATSEVARVYRGET